MTQLGELAVSEYMTHGAITIDDREKLVAAIRLLSENRLSVVPVVDAQGSVVGILSTTDLISHTHEIQSDVSALSHVTEKTQNILLQLLIEQGDTTYVRDVMTAPVETVSPTTNLVVAARKLEECQYHHLPVVDEQHRPIGMLSTSDFVRAFAKYGGLLAG